MSPNSMADPKMLTAAEIINGVPIYTCEDLNYVLPRKVECCKRCHRNNMLQFVRYHGKIYSLCCNPAEEIMKHS